MSADARYEFIEMMGRHFEEEGTARIAGRLFGLLILTEEPVSLDDAAERLQVSKGSVSSNARLLEEWGVAERVTRPGDRRDFYRVAPDMGRRLLERQIERVELMNRRLDAAKARMEPLPGAVRDRIDRTVRFNQMALRSLAGMLEEVRAGGTKAE